LADDFRADLASSNPSSTFDMTPPNYRALCAELDRIADDYHPVGIGEAELALEEMRQAVTTLAESARALLAASDDSTSPPQGEEERPEAVGVTDEKIENAAETIYESMRYAHRAPHKGETPKWDRLGNSLMQAEARGCARAVLSLYGTAHPAPVPVGERLPGVGDCDERGDCWWFEAGMDAWYIDTYQGNWTHWLPHGALPLPEAKP
jgi:hypothetical protein